MSRKFQVVLNGKAYEAEVDEMASSFSSEMVALSSKGGHTCACEKKAEPIEKKAEPVVEKAQESAPSQSSTNGAFTATAPLQGIVLGLNVKVGDSINEGDVFVKIEAMKMENEIPSPRSGKVTKVYVTDGAQVKSDDPLIDIE